MKILCTLIFLLFYLPSFSQTDNPKINNIRKIVEQINNDSGYRTKVLDNEDFLEHTTDGGGQLTGYFKNGHLVKIREWIGLSSCVNITEYYLQDNKLIFTYTEGKLYHFIDSLETFDYGKLDKKTMECRFYFDNGKVIKKNFRGSTLCSGKPNIGWAKENLDECFRYIKLFAKK